MRHALCAALFGTAVIACGEGSGGGSKELTVELMPSTAASEWKARVVGVERTNTVLWQRGAWTKLDTDKTDYLVVTVALTPPAPSAGLPLIERYCAELPPEGLAFSVKPEEGPTLRPYFIGPTVGAVDETMFGLIGAGGSSADSSGELRWHVGETRAANDSVLAGTRADRACRPTHLFVHGTGEQSVRIVFPDSPRSSAHFRLSINGRTSAPNPPYRPSPRGT